MQALHKIIFTIFAECYLYISIIIVLTVKRFIEEDRLPHLLFYGPPGTGKTSTILAVAKQIYSAREFNSMVLEVGDLYIVNEMCYRSYVHVHVNILGETYCFM